MLNVPKCLSPMRALIDHTCVSIQYGKQFVPVSADDEAYLAYKPERGLHLLGFLPADDIPQHQFLKVCACPDASDHHELVCCSKPPQMMQKWCPAPTHHAASVKSGCRAAQ